MSLSIVVLVASVFTAIAVYIDKFLVKRGISRRDYFYYMCVSMIPFALIMIGVELYLGVFRFDWKIASFLLLIAAMVFRYYKQHTVVGYLKHLNPYEASAYMSLGILLAYGIDFFLKIRTFVWLDLISVLITIVGVFLLADVKLKRVSLQKDLIIKIFCDVILGYIAYFLLQGWSNAIYILLLNLLLTLLFSKRYTWSYHVKQKSLIGLVFIQQTFGFVTVYLGNYIASQSVVFLGFVRPLSIVMVVLIAFFIRDNQEKPTLVKLIAIIFISLGVLLINFNPFD